MCGIVAILNKNNKGSVEIEPLIEKISHRGIYQNEIYKFEKGSFGTNRLPIVDEKNATQPIFSQDKTVFVIHNGEIFNHKEIRRNLEMKGYSFKTHSDTEVLVYLWEEYKEKMVEYIDSEMFAFVIYDFKTDTVFVVRDRLGVKPLFYSETEEQILFASEMKSFSQLDEVLKIKEFPPGHFYKNGEFTKYYDLNNSQSDEINGEESKILNLLEEAVRKRIDTELPVAVFLSGGVDSSLVMHYAHKYHDDVTALILGTEDSEDRKYAESLCREKGWRYRVLDAVVDYSRNLEDIIYYLENDNPNVVRHSFANDLISKFAKDSGYKIVLTGEGADELFGGYNEFFNIPESKINLACCILLKSMSLGNLARVDRMAMRHTIETRCPFFDNALLDYGLSISGFQKKGKVEDKTYTKLILRKAATKVLSHEIAFRQKIPFANGAGMDIGYNYQRKDGVLAKIAKEKNTTEEEMYTEIYDSFQFNKLERGSVVVKDNLINSL